jgi:hypothetical protein
MVWTSNYLASFAVSLLVKFRNPRVDLLRWNYIRGLGSTILEVGQGRASRHPLEIGDRHHYARVYQITSIGVFIPVACGHSRWISR